MLLNQLGNRQVRTCSFDIRRHHHVERPRVGRHRWQLDLPNLVNVVAKQISQRSRTDDQSWVIWSRRNEKDAGRKEKDAGLADRFGKEEQGCRVGNGGSTCNIGDWQWLLERAFEPTEGLRRPVIRRRLRSRPGEEDGDESVERELDTIVLHTGVLATDGLLKESEGGRGKCSPAPRAESVHLSGLPLVSFRASTDLILHKLYCLYCHIFVQDVSGRVVVKTTG